MNKSVYVKIVLFVILSFSKSSFSQQDYTLERLIGEMLESNYGIKILKNEVVVAANNNNIGAAGYLPTIQVNADHYRSAYNTKQAFFSGAVNEANAAKSSSTSASAMLNWTFFDGFKMFAIDKRLDLQEDLSTMNLTAEMEMKIYQASVQFYTLLQLQELRTIYQKSLEISNARYEQQLLKEKLGSASEVQLIQARLDLFSDSSSYLKNENLIENTVAGINYLLGRDQSESIVAQGSLVQMETLEWELLKARAIDQNTSILINKANIAIRDQERKEIRSNYFPQLNFYAQYVFNLSENQVGILNSNRSYGPGFGVSLTWNILNDLSTYSGMKNAKLSTENATLQLADQEMYIAAELKKSFDNYLWTVRNLALEQQNIDQAGLNFEIAQKAYNSGAITDLELREFQFSIIQSNLRYFQAQLEQKIAEMNLRLTSGDFKEMI